MKFNEQHDQHINPIKRHFGLKSKYIRDPNEPRYIFEIFICETLIDKVLEKFEMNSIETDREMREVHFADIKHLEDDTSALNKELI
jgi:hypothetical protein